MAAETMRDVITERAAAGASVLFSSHQLDLVEDMAENVVVIAEGRRVASGPIAALRSASPSRRLHVTWEQPTVGWQPLEGRVISIADNTAEIELAAGADFAVNIAHAMDAGAVTSIGIEPPRLDEIFSELVRTPRQRRR